MKNLLSVCWVNLDIFMPYELLHDLYHIILGTNRI
jgi:hypothetical protein